MDCKRALYNHRARAKKDGQGVDYNADDLEQLVADAVGNPCEYCRKPLKRKEVQIDHCTPTSRGGSYARWNLQAICKGCNQRKGDLTHEEFSELMELIQGWKEEAYSSLMRRLRSTPRWRAR